MPPQQSGDPLWTMLLRVTLALGSLALGTLAVKAALGAAKKSRDWVAGQVRDSIKKEIAK